jgi:hypothetical protein
MNVRVNVPKVLKPSKKEYVNIVTNIKQEKGLRLLIREERKGKDIMSNDNTERDILYICKGWFNDEYESTLDALNAYYHREYGNEDITMDYRFVLNLFLKPCLIKYGTKNSIRCLLEPTMLESSMDYNQTPMSKDYMMCNRALTAIINLKKDDIFDGVEEKENVI